MISSLGRCSPSGLPPIIMVATLIWICIPAKKAAIVADGYPWCELLYEPVRWTTAVGPRNEMRVCSRGEPNTRTAFCIFGLWTSPRFFFFFAFSLMLRAFLHSIRTTARSIHPTSRFNYYTTMAKVPTGVHMNEMLPPLRTRLELTQLLSVTFMDRLLELITDTSTGNGQRRGHIHTLRE